MKLSEKLGKSLVQVLDQLPIKKIHIDLGDVQFDLKVRTPLKREIEELNARILSPTEDEIKAIYDAYAEPILKTLIEGGEDFEKAMAESKQKIEKLDDDLIVDGTSVRQISYFQAVEQKRIEEYFHLLETETGEAVTESYKEIISEFPEFAIKAIIAEIQKVIAPDYSSTKKN